MQRSIFQKIVLLLVAFIMLSGKVEKGFEALSIYDYFKAKKFFSKSLKKATSPAAFGLSTIYFRTDNPFTDIDSAYKYIIISQNNYKFVEEKKRLKYQQFGLDSLRIDSLKKLINDKIFDSVLVTQSLQEFEEYINIHKDAHNLETAILYRDSLAFIEAEKINTSIIYQAFCERYPKAEQYHIAKAKYEKALFEEETSSLTIPAYEQFIKNYPNSPYREDALEQIYFISTRNRTINAYYTFINQYPDHPKVDLAWRNIYHIYTKKYTPEILAQFTMDYPDYPFKSEILKDFNLLQTKYYPIQENGKWGFTNEYGEKVIRPEYESVGEFIEGYAVVQKNDKYGYINKTGNVVIKLIYDDAEAFEEGYAVVAKGENYGLIDKNGHQFLPFIYDAISIGDDDRILVSKNEKYGYLNIRGELAIPYVYDLAGDFENGYAYVGKNGKMGIINHLGKEVLPITFDWVENFENGLARFRQDDFFGLADKKGNIIVQSQYKYLGKPKQNRLLAIKGGKVGYLNSKGETVIPFDFDEYPGVQKASEFENNLAKVVFKKKVGLIDTLGKYAIPPQYNEIKLLTKELAAVNTNNKWFFYNLPKRLAYGNGFENIYTEQDSLIRFMDKALMGFVDISGRVVIPATYQSAEDFKGGFSIVSKDGLIGIINKQNEKVIPLSYSKIEYISPKVVALYVDGELNQYKNLKTGKVVWQAK